MIIISVTCRAGVVPVSMANFVFSDEFHPHRIRKLKLTCTDIEPAALMTIINDPEVIGVEVAKPATTKQFFDDEREYYAAIGRENERLRLLSDAEIRKLVP